MENQKKILLIDNEPDFVDAFSRTFEAKDYQMITDSGKRIEEVMKRGPDIVVLGTIAPAGEAFRLHQWLKGHPRYKGTPLLVIDARVEERDIKGWRREDGMQLEAEGYVSKPVEPAELVPRIQNLLAGVHEIIRVLVTDDHTMVRDGVCAVLALQRI